MREIKFRGLRTDGKGWVYGMLFHNNKIVTETVSYESPLVEKGSPCYKYDYINIIPESVGHFIGLTDKNDKEIYFGDVLQTPTGIATVVWQDIAVALKSPGSEAVDWEHSSYYAKCEIIGNIHENPELLNN